MGARSKGCISCKARRVKCDEVHPSCCRCQKAGIKCLGYGPPIEFVDERPRIEKTLAVLQMQQQELNAMKRLSRPLHHTARLPTLSSYHDLAYPKSCTIMSLAASEDLMLVCFLAKKLLEGRVDTMEIQHRISSGPSSSPPSAWAGAWLSEMMKVPHRSLTALAAMFVGKAYGLQDVIISAFKLYGGALSDMQKTLQDPDTKAAFDTMASMTILCMFELATSRVENGWIRHAEALEQLMQARGPSKHKRPPEKSMFLEQRVILVAKAIKLQQRTFLSQQAWKTIPWDYDSEPKQPFEFLIDILCDTADHLANLKAVLTTTDHVKWMEFRNSVVASLVELNAWWRHWTGNMPKFCWEIGSNLETSVAADASGVLFATIFQYDELWVAYTLCTHNAVRILLLHVIRSLVKTKAETDGLPLKDGFFDEDNDSPLLGISSNSTGLAHEIIRSMEYCNKQSGGFMGTFCAVTILDVAYGALDKKSRIAKWLWGKESQKQERNGEVQEFSPVLTLLSSCQVDSGLHVKSPDICCSIGTSK